MLPQQRKCHPEEQPQEFSRLQSAYKEALKYASSHEVGSLGDDKVYENEIKIVISDSIDNKTKNVEESDSYDFGDIKLTTEEDEITLLKKEFWKDFYAIVWHPYLRNKKIVWDHLLTGPKYMELIKDSDFCDLFIWNFSEFDNIWNVFTVRHINKRFVQIRNDLSKYIQVTSWKKLLHIEPARDILMFKKCCTKKEKRLFEQIWKRENRKIFKNHFKLEEYLKSYFLYVSDKRDTFEKIFRESIKARRKQAKASAALAVLSVIIILGWSVSDLRPKNMLDRMYNLAEKYASPDAAEREATAKEFDDMFETYNNWVSRQ